MQSLEVSAKTVEEAIDLALKQLEIDREEVDVVVVTEGRSGILGIGSEPAIVRVSPKDTTPQAVTLARETLEEIFQLLKVDAEVRLKTDGFGDSELSLDITGDDSGLLIGRGGTTLTSLQFLINFIISKRLGKWSPVNIDAEGYRQRRYQTLEALAQRLAKRVSSSRRSFTLEPMPASDRRIIHITLAEDNQVITESSGYGDGRRVTIKPKVRD